VTTCLHQNITVFVPTTGFKHFMKLNFFSSVGWKWGILTEKVGSVSMHLTWYVSQTLAFCEGIDCYYYDYCHIYYVRVITVGIAVFIFDYLVIREKSSLYERNIVIVLSYLNRCINCAKLQGRIFVLDKPISEDRFCLKIWWSGNGDWCHLPVSVGSYHRKD
jgi:hypothetical protein